MIDGITEILTGLVLIFLPIILIHVSFIVFFVLFILFGQPVVDFIRERTTYPRLGRVELRTETDSADFSLKKSMLEFSLLILSAIVITLIVMFIIEGQIFNLQLWYKWVPLLFGLIMFGPSLFLVEKTGQRRYYIIGFFATILGFLFSILIFPDEKLGMFLYFFSLGIISIIVGVIRYISFIRKYPVIEVEEE